MGAGIPTIPNLELISQNQSLNLIISTESAKTLAAAFNDGFNKWSGVLAASASAISSFFAYWAIRQNNKNQKEQLLENIHNQFFEINRDIANRGKTFTKHDYELLANFMDRVAELVEKKKLSFKDTLSFRSLTIEDDFVEFVENYRERHGNNYFKSLTKLIKDYRSYKE